MCVRACVHALHASTDARVLACTHTDTLTCNNNCVLEKVRFHYRTDGGAGVAMDCHRRQPGLGASGEIAPFHARIYVRRHAPLTRRESIFGHSGVRIDLQPT